MMTFGAWRGNEAKGGRHGAFPLYGPGPAPERTASWLREFWAEAALRRGQELSKILAHQ